MNHVSDLTGSSGKYSLLPIYWFSDEYGFQIPNINRVAEKMQHAPNCN